MRSGKDLDKGRFVEAATAKRVGAAQRRKNWDLALLILTFLLTARGAAILRHDEPNLADPRVALEAV